ncbi:hypothetical protein [Streptomyces sp. NBC_01538]|uniref:hypothetical protein n=1 Tax=Streptomyces sp. NBC_01538 TaxID=2903897 RepID=UPI00386F42B6
MAQAVEALVTAIHPMKPDQLAGCGEQVAPDRICVLSVEPALDVDRELAHREVTSVTVAGFGSGVAQLGGHCADRGDFAHAYRDEAGPVGLCMRPSVARVRAVRPSRTASGSS